MSSKDSLLKAEGNKLLYKIISNEITTFLNFRMLETLPKSTIVSSLAIKTHCELLQHVEASVVTYLNDCMHDTSSRFDDVITTQISCKDYDKTHQQYCVTLFNFVSNLCTSLEEMTQLLTAPSKK